MQQLTEQAVAVSEAQVAAAQRAVKQLEASAAESAALAVAHQDVAASQSSVAQRVAEVPATADKVVLSTDKTFGGGDSTWLQIVAWVQAAAERMAAACAQAWLWLRLWVTDAWLMVLGIWDGVRGWVVKRP